MGNTINDLNNDKESKITVKIAPNFLFHWLTYKVTEAVIK